MKQPEVRPIGQEYITQIAALTHHLNPALDLHLLEQRADEMFTHEHYYCFGLFWEQELIGVASGWITVRLYSGKQLELDNVIILPKHQSKGYGQHFLDHLEAFAEERNCLTVELNAYVGNNKAHQFYERLDYVKLGFHFQKKIQ